MAGEYRRNWLLKHVVNGFESVMMVHGTEREMQEYMRSELGCVPAYTGASEAQCEAHRLLGGKCYMAPEIRDQVPWESPIK